MKKQLFFLAAIVMIIGFGCSDDSESADLATDVAGLYTGYWSYSGSHAGTCEVTKLTSSTVSLKLEILGVAMPSSPPVDLSEGGNGKIILKASDSEGGKLDGTIQGKTINLTVDDGTTSLTFTGTRN